MGAAADPGNDRGHPQTDGLRSTQAGPAPGAAQRRVQQQLDTAGIRRELEESTDQEFDELWPSLSKIIESQAAPPKEVRV